LSTTLFSIFEIYITYYTPGRKAEIKDILVSIMAVLLTGIVVYTLPVIGELEMALKHKFEYEVSLVRKNKKNNF